MPGPDFLDTYVVVYAYDSTDLRKRAVAQKFAATLLHKLSPAARPDDVLAVLDALAPIKVITPDREVVRRAIEVKSVYRVHFYDGMIIAAEERGGCQKIWSEDLNPGQDYFGVIVENPFQ